VEKGKYEWMHEQLELYDIYHDTIVEVYLKIMKNYQTFIDSLKEAFLDDVIRECDLRDLVDCLRGRMTKDLNYKSKHICMQHAWEMKRDEDRRGEKV